MILRAANHYSLVAFGEKKIHNVCRMELSALSKDASPLSGI